MLVKGGFALRHPESKRRAGGILAPDSHVSGGPISPFLQPSCCCLLKKPAVSHRAWMGHPERPHCSRPVWGPAAGVCPKTRLEMLKLRLCMDLQDPNLHLNRCGGTVVHKGMRSLAESAPQRQWTRSAHSQEVDRPCILQRSFSEVSRDWKDGAGGGIKKECLAQNYQ